MKTDYTSPFFVAMLYAIGTLLGVGALIFGIAGHGAGFALVLPAIGLFLLAYLFDVLTNILHELRHIRRQVEDGTLFTAPAPTDAARREPPGAESPSPVRGSFEYYLMVNERSTGPFPLRDLLDRLRTGALGGDSQVQRTGSTNWVSLATLAT